MYEDITYEGILKRMLDRIPSTMDKREGSIIYDALAPAAVELQQMYIELEVILFETFGDTASRQYLIKRALERGITPYPATYSVLKATSAPSDVDIAIGSRFSLNELNYTIIEKIEDGSYKIACDTVGAVGNKYFGALIPIDYIQGLESISITELLIPGEDEEETEAFRERYLNSFNSQSFGGNVADYKEKIGSLEGVANDGVKIYPAWKGGGKVKAVIINSDYEKPSDTLINEVQAKIDPIGNQGVGAGIAPIGHTVTIAGCGETDVDITLRIKFQEGWDWLSVMSQVDNTIDDYFKELASEWGKTENITVRISQIEARLLELAGISDVADTELNGETHNLTIDSDNIPVRRNMTCIEIT
jgi:uncharacterized phage protein gp47/JayE